MSEVRGLPQRERTIEVNTYLPVPASRSREFWTKWKIQHIRQLATSGHATNEPIVPTAERTRRILDKLLLKETSEVHHSYDSVSTGSPFTAGSSLALSSPLYLGDMSFGALSGVPNIAIAQAAESTGVMAGTGEGGLLKEAAEASRITVQWASARFGVDVSSLMAGQAVVIKIGQGAKPGIGGHLPGVKVTQPISETRRIPVGRDAISPAPHHDIYSIEDLGQRIAALKEVTKKPVLVKVGATNYIPYIASGIARMGAAGIIIDGAGAGTGAAPSIVKNNVGIPVELATAAVDSILRREGLRDGFTVIAAGRVSTPEDSLKLMALGADITSLGTATLMALGCLMVHKCHLGYCPAVLTNKIAPNQVRLLSLRQSVEWLVNLVNGWTDEMKLLLSRAGLDDITEIIGERQFLRHGPLNEETLSILGLDGEEASSSASSSATPQGPAAVWELPDRAGVWNAQRLSTLREMAGTTGKFPAESEISSMGTNSPPFVEEPVRLSDWLVSDGAQVTRPSIDPYREEIEISTFIGGIDLRLSSPFFFTHLPATAAKSIHAKFARTAVSMGLLFDAGESEDESLTRYSSRLIGPWGGMTEVKVRTVRLPEYAGLVRRSEVHREVILLRSPASREALNDLVENPGLLERISGILIDEDEEGSSIQLELAVSLLDRSLKRSGMRGRLDILAAGNMVRGSDDIFKLLALGADCVGIGKAALLAVGVEELDREVVLDPKITQRLENLVVAIQRDIRLLAGAAGVSNINSTLIGNRELLRSVDLEPSIRGELGVKPAGAV